ncbi:GlxA family transcriptional regulator [Pseudonocardia phyllosphaerae]|uniref:GlxA family transcriptional regulator n=1 Tax=Pseudonocardia phyllosphaerae TaxID=3390502 RepID=UPI003979D05C
MTACTPPHRVVVLARDGVLPMELGLVHQLFPMAHAADGTPLYDVVTCAVAPGSVRTTGDFTITVEHGLEAFATAGTVVVPAAKEDYGPGGPVPAELREAFTRLDPATRIASICTGAFVLAELGLLDGRRATTHWNSADRFRRRFPAVTLDPNVLFVDEGRVLTSAGEAAGIDLCLHLIRTDHGAAVANEVAAEAVVPAYREGGQAQFVRRAIPEPSGSSTTRARAWALTHLDRPVSLAELAAQEAMSVRTFTRRFRDEVGVSPGRWITLQRVERARDLLERTDLGVDDVAREAGFATAASLRRHLRDRLATSPTGYRSTFHGAPGRG